jgi:hypothetical protein
VNTARIGAGAAGYGRAASAAGLDEPWPACTDFPASAPLAPLPYDHPSGPWAMWAPREPASPGLDGAGSPSSSGRPELPRRRPVARRADGYGYRPPTARPPRGPSHARHPGRHEAPTAPDQPRLEVSTFRRTPAAGPGEAVGYQRQAVGGWQEFAGYRAETGASEPSPWPATAFQNGHQRNDDSLGIAGQVLTLADDRAARIAHEAQADAAAIRQAAERDAAAIREAAERDAAELRARLDALLGDVGRVVAAYIAESLATPATSAPAPAAFAQAPAASAPAPAAFATAPAVPVASPTMPSVKPAAPARSPRPATRPKAEPGTAPRTRTAPPDTAPPDTAPRTRPGAPATPTATPAKKGQAAGRQRRAIRIAAGGTAALLSIAAIGGLTEIGSHGFNFFVFREGGQGETPGNFHDTNFLARQAAQAQHHEAAAKGRHRKVAQDH